MTIIADSGSTKTDWMVVGADTLQVKTQGLNPVLMSKEQLLSILREELMPQIQDFLKEDEEIRAFFYGAGVRPEMVSKTCEVLETALKEKVGRIHVCAASDLLGAAHALCGDREGVACILGTGANSCLYDGQKIVQNTPALGFILGDEGGGAALGKAFLNGIFKGSLPVWLRDDFLRESGLTLPDIIRKVYREPMPNRFLASLSLYIGQHLDNVELERMVVENFRLFFRRNILPYGRPDLPVSFVGSIAAHYQEQLRQAAADEGFCVGLVVKSPLSALAAYHS